MRYSTIIFTALFIGFLSCAAFAQAPEYGIASVYADKLAGRATASGELYDLNKFTASHKTLPFGTFVKVTRIDNERSVIVKINDRGPHKEGRVVDLSRAAANQLGLEGLLSIRLDVIDEATASTTTSSSVKNSSATEGRFEWFPKDIEPASTVDPDRQPAVASSEKEQNSSSTFRSLLIQPDKPTQPSDIPTEYNNTSKPPAQVSKSNEVVTAKGSATVPATKKATSPATYDILNMVPAPKKEVAPLEIEPVVSTTATAAPKYAVQVASFTSMENAESHAEQLRSKGFNNTAIFTSSAASGSARYKVVLGEFDATDAANAFRSQLKSNYKMDGFVIEVGG